MIPPASPMWDCMWVPGKCCIAEIQSGMWISIRPTGRRTFTPLPDHPINKIHNGYSRQREWEESLDHMGPEELPKIAVEDRYFQDDHIFEVLGVPVVVTGDVLAEILAQLPEGKRDIILLSFFLEMTDREIAEYLHVVHQTVSKRRIGILKELRKTLEKEGYEWSEL